ncbi:MAG: hypothetical protein IBJ03_06785 [Gemmatimonadaceae bacterium]|nr:hypothetical protein [Gemmatimonadaceae bacterium]
MFLEAIDSVSLSGSESGQVGRITHFLPTSEGYFVIDGSNKVVLAFDATGALTAQVGRNGMEMDQYEDPYRVAVRGDSIFVLDLARFSHVLVFDRGGAYVGGVNWKNERMPTDMQLTNTGMAISTTVKPERGKPSDVMHIVTEAKSFTGCQIDPRIIESDRKGGMLGSMVFATISKNADRIFCALPTTPVVQVVDTSGRLLPPVTSAPPFYVAPLDKPLTMNTKQMMAFNASFTTHVAFTPTPSGFVSTYSQYDTVGQRTKYMLFACDSANAIRTCGTSQVDRRVLHVASPDTVFLEEPRVDGRLVVGRYRIKGLGR